MSSGVSGGWFIRTVGLSSLAVSGQTGDRSRVGFRPTTHDFRNGRSCKRGRLRALPPTVRRFRVRGKCSTAIRSPGLPCPAGRRRGKDRDPERFGPLRWTAARAFSGAARSWRWECVFVWEDGCLGIRLFFGGACIAEIDRQRVSQAVSNLLDNALRHTPPGGTIRVTVRRQARMGEINVADSGRGLPEGVDIWDRRAREHFPQTAPTGLGLGLSLVRVIAESHGGWADVESAPGRGASFSIWLPLAGE